MVMLEVEDLEVYYDTEEGSVKAVDGVSFSIGEGENVGIVGESGSGKSMFAASLLDAIPEPGLLSGEVTYYPEKGEPVDVLGLAPEELRQLRWEEIAMVFQGAQSSFNPTITLRDHFKETIEAHNYNMQQAMDHARELLTELYLEPDRVLDAYPHELSGGMQQRVGLARALAVDPEILLMDEPFGALDAQTKDRMQTELLQLWESERKTVVFITHDISEAIFMADRVLVMSSKPATIVRDIEIEFERPRWNRRLEIERDDRFQEIERQIRRDLGLTVSEDKDEVRV